MLLRKSLSAILLLALVAGWSSGCARPAEDPAAAEAPPILRADPSDDPPVLLPSQLRRRLKANENARFERLGNDIVEASLFQSGVKSIEALKGVPLRSLDLGMNDVSDLAPIKGMPLRSLILENTPIDDISAIAGMQLEVLHLQNTKVTDLSTLVGMPLRELNLMNVPVEDLTHISDLPLKTLWIPQTGVTDIAPLQGKVLVSLDIQGTGVASLEPLSSMTTLRRLNIADTPVTDVSPLKGLSLERITLTPSTVQDGMEVLRAMPSLTQILISMQGQRQSAGEFWAKYDAGVWSDDPLEGNADTAEATAIDDPPPAERGEDTPLIPDSSPSESAETSE